MLRCVTRALRLAIPTYLGGAGAFAVMFWIYGIPVLGAATASSDRSAFLLLVFPIGLLIVGLLWYLLLRVLYELLLNTLWSNPPQFLRTSQSRISALWNYLVMVIGMLPIALIYLGKYVFNGSGASGLRNLEPLTQLAFQFFWLWLAIAIGCYRIKKPTLKRVVQPQRI